MLNRHDTEHKSFEAPDETRQFHNGRAEVLEVGGGEIGRLIFEPGWRWSNDVKPLAGTESCEAPHFQYHLSGRLGIRMDDGTEFVAEAGRRDLTAEWSRCMGYRRRSVVVVDWYGASNYAKVAEPTAAGAQ